MASNSLESHSLDVRAPATRGLGSKSGVVRAAARALDLLLDPTILFSFDRYGFARHALSFDPSDLDVSLQGRVALVTGANSGIGYETAKALASLGAEVWLLCRSQARGQAALEQLRHTYPLANVRLQRLDVSDLSDVRAFARDFKGSRIDILVHNAGVLPATLERSPQGIESTLATNLLGPFLLTELLWPKLKASSEARVILVSSGGMYPRKLVVKELLEPREPFDGVDAYANTKRAMVVLNQLWADRWQGTSVTSHCMHPGWADTPAVASSLPTFHRLTRLILRTPEEGADTVIWLAARAQVPPSGQFWFDRKARRIHFLPGQKESAAERQALWEMLQQRSQAGG